MKINKNNFFWISYTDLMTSLFFIMLILFVMASSGLYRQKKATETELKNIRDMQTAVSQLDSRYFVADTIHKRWILRRQINFASKSAVIPEGDKPYLTEVGHNLKFVINNIRDSTKLEKYKDMDITFLVLIEGMASRTPFYIDDWQNNYVLSYNRALAVYRFLQRDLFDDPENRKLLEVQIAGSGEEGIRPHSDETIESSMKNQTIMLQIIPKIKYRQNEGD